MNFYLDFEATQFSHRIISIGCIAENGNNFYTLVKLPKGEKLTKFIIELTQITEEKLASAPTADQAFNLLSEFVAANSTDPTYFFYGNEDVHFIERTIHKMEDKDAIKFANSIKAKSKDYFPSVQKFFSRTCGGLSLKNVYNFCVNDEKIFWHNALNDAMMLKYVVEHLDEKDPSLMEYTIKTSVITPSPKTSTRITLPKFFNGEWNETKNRWSANTFANADNYKVKIKCKTNTKKKKYFNSMKTAVLWLIKFNIVKGVKATRKEDIEAVIEKIKKNPNGKYGFIWEIKE